ncbi:aminoglycoside phosphotransferase family protein [Phaeobacter sp.]|uniref:phosphotransferase family protein n=1 Tax=Phaeobacter sp. TaxID=1902409 RepID=UPI0025F1582B|nr:aminoglycoside phosphotransferase family protein [Phaeobacter sp.]
MERTLQHDRTAAEERFLAHLANCGVIGRAVAKPLIGGRSNRVWQVGPVVVKLYANGLENPLFANDPDRERTVLTALRSSGMVPQLQNHGEFESRHWLAYTHRPGQTWTDGVCDVACLLDRLHRHPAKPDLPLGANGSDALVQQTKAILAQCPAPQHIAALRPKGHVAPSAHLTLIHGDPVPGNIVSHGGALTLIDWQCPQLGDAAEDLAVFLSPAMQLIYRGEPLTNAEEAEFLASYSDQTVVSRYRQLKPWYHWRMAAYCLWRSSHDRQENAAALDAELMALEHCNRG